MKKTCNLICVWRILEDISKSIEAVSLQFQNYSKRFGFGWRCRVELNSRLTEVENTFLQDTCSVTTLTTHESQQSTYNLITSIFYLKHQPIVPQKYDFEIISFYHWGCLSLTYWITDSLTDWLTHSCSVNLIDVTLARDDAYLKLVEVVTVAHVDDEKRVDNSLVQIHE